MENFKKLIHRLIGKLPTPNLANTIFLPSSLSFDLQIAKKSILEEVICYRIPIQIL